MKKGILFLALFTIILSSCKKVDDIISTPVNTALTSGTWRIGSYTNSSTSRTGLFLGYNLLFNKNGSASAIKNGLTTSGTWNASNNNREVYFNFGSADPLGNLKKSWIVVQSISNEIVLQDPSNNTDQLRLVRL